MSTEKKEVKTVPLQIGLFLAGSLFIMSGLTGIRAGRQVHEMTGSPLNHSGMTVPGNVMTYSHVEQNWMYPVGILSLCAGVATTVAAGIVTIRQRA